MQKHDKSASNSKPKQEDKLELKNQITVTSKVEKLELEQITQNEDNLLGKKKRLDSEEK